MTVALSLLVGACAGSSGAAGSGPLAPSPAPAAASAPTTTPVPSTTPASALATTAAGGAPASLIERGLEPAALDPAADKYLAKEYAFFDPRAPRAAYLVVYLVGANNTPDRGRSMGAFLAGLGFPVIIPGYANDYDIRKLCQAPETPDPDCHGKLRLEAFEGKDLSPHIQISPANGLETRIVRMLTALAKEQTKEPSPDPQANPGWDRYLAGPAPRWDQIIIAGHSHGASSSGIIGKVRKVHRVVMLSGPFDNRGGEPAPWTRMPSATPVDRVFAFSHTQEEQYAGHIKNWTAMGLPPQGPVILVETAAPPYAGSHQLSTALPPEGGANPHGTTAAGKAAPRLEDGRYRFEAVWRYLFGL